MNSNLHKISFILLLLLFFAGCKMGKNYKRPDIALPKQFGATASADTSSVADLEWKKFFTDTGLQQLIDKGLHYNNDLLAGIKRMEMAQQQARQSKLLQLPELGLAISAQISRPSGNSLT